MGSQEIKYLTEAYSNLYSESETDCQELYDSFLDLCILDGGFTTLEECEDFAETLVADNLVEDFIVNLLEYYEVENLNESFEFLGENSAAALRAVINALSSGGRLKAGLKPLTALGKKSETVVKGAAASTSIRGARAQRTPVPTQEPGKYLKLLQQKRTPKPLSPQGQEIKDLSKKMGGGLMGTRPTPRPSGAPGLGDPIQKAIDVGRKSKEAQRLALRAQRMSKDNYGKLLNTPLGKAAATTLAAAGFTAAATSTNEKKPAAKSNPADSVGKYNTKDPDGTVRNRLKVGPKIVGTGSVAGDFDAAFKKARSSGAKEFEFQGKKYNTKVRGEEVDYFDVVMDHLISEGYVDTNEDALVMMSALDENAVARIISRALPGVIKSGGQRLSKIKLPPKMDPALKFVKDKIKQQFGASSLMGTPEQKYAAAAQRAANASEPKPKPVKREYENPYRPRAGESD